jgi:hypothetical protein
MSFYLIVQKTRKIGALRRAGAACVRRALAAGGCRGVRKVQVCASRHTGLCSPCNKKQELFLNGQQSNAYYTGIK